jgi:hypothetical protein
MKRSGAALKKTASLRFGWRSEAGKRKAEKVESLKAKGQRGQLALLLVAGGMLLVPR